MELKDQMSIIGFDAQRKIEEERVKRFPKAYQEIISALGCAKEIAETEDEGFPIMDLLNQFYTIGFYNGVNVGLDKTLAEYLK